ncbi:hypothetical protein AAHN97_10470 [Chitinophaga niabensis]|uniref:hypothetical protein n=1 Tax=Chitinophaga niabensis TaxID=536979 RepID=UPI0031BBA62E
MKAKITLALILVSMQISFAQQTKIFNQNASRSNHTRISLSAGGIFTQNDQLQNGFDVQADAFLPFYRKGRDGSVKGSGFALGINISGNYSGVKNSSPDNIAVANRYPVYSATHTVSTEKGGSISSNFSGLLGVQAMFGLGRAYISPVVSTGYSGFTLQGFTQTGAYTANGQSQNKDLVKRQKQNSGGMVFKPALKIGYSLTPALSLFASSAYIIGPDIKWTTENWVPQGGFNPNNSYEPQQMQNGSWSAANNSSKYKAVEINIGLSLAIGKRTHKPKAIKPGGAVSNSYAKTAAQTPEELEKTKTDLLNNLFVTKDGIPQLKPDLFKEALTPGDLKGQKVSITKAGRSYIYLGNQDDLAAIISLPSGNPVNRQSGCADCTTTTCNGTTYDCTCVNGFCMCVLCPERSTLTPLPEEIKIIDQNGKSISTKGVKSINAAALALPGNPIGGIIVKGGKNPGGNAINLTTNENGEVIFTATEAGEYKLQFTAPEPSGNEQGVKASTKRTGVRTYTAGRKNETPAINIVAGNPIGGIIVKGGKNPSPGSGWGAINVMTDENGEVTFNIHEPGEYKLQATAPASNGKSISEKGI